MKTSLIVTSIFSPTDAMKELAAGVKENDWDFYIIGDNKSPSNFSLNQGRFVSIEEQRNLNLHLSAQLPENHYCRKNLGYLLAIRNGAELIVETDDDNFPLPTFFQNRSISHESQAVRNEGWINVYGYFSDTDVWPRGFPLEEINQQLATRGTVSTAHWPVQQGLADQNPDVDAVYRLTRQLPISFEHGMAIGLQRNQWCPFNSQNTTWFKVAFPLMYLPSYCSFRMTDIWRSFVSQRLLWTLGYGVLFHEASVLQVRNEHDLHKDFFDEMEGYLNNNAIASALESLDLKMGYDYLAENLTACYECLIHLGLVGAEERPLIQAWIADMRELGCLS